MHTDAAPHDTSASRTSGNETSCGVGIRWIDQAPLLQRSTSGTSTGGYESIDEVMTEPTTKHSLCDGHETRAWPNNRAQAEPWCGT